MVGNIHGVIQGVFLGRRPRIAPPPAATLRSSAVQRQANGEMFQLPPSFATLATGGGQPLPAAVRERMESAFGTSFSDVRVHVGPQASSIGALAFTLGTDVYF